jgi:UDP-glucose 4-epimerase
VLPRFFEAALTGRDITVFGDGTQVRSFTHVRDIVDVMVTVMNAGVQGEVFNAGNPANKLDINTLAQLVKEITASSSRIVHVDPKTIYGPLYEEAFDKIPNIGKLQRMLNWQPRIGLMETLEDTAAFFREAVSVQA